MDKIQTQLRKQSIVTVGDIETCMQQLHDALAEKDFCDIRIEYDQRLHAPKISFYMVFYLTDYQGRKTTDNKSEFIYGETISDAFREAMNYIQALKSPKELALEVFIKRAAKLTEDMEWFDLRPDTRGTITAMMRALTTNILEDYSQVKVPGHDRNSPPVDEEIPF